MTTTSFAELDSPQRLRSILAERGYFSTDAPADKLFDLPPDQIGLMQGAQIVALAGPAADDNTLVVLWVPRPSLIQDVLRRIRRRLAENTRDGLIFCAQSWQKATLYLLRQEDIPQTGQDQPVADKVPFWELNFSALRPADRQGLALLDIRTEDPYDLGKPLLRAFRRAMRETLYQNQGLFSNHYLNERLEADNEPHNAAWHALAADMPALHKLIQSALAAGVAGRDLAQTEALVIRPLLQALGWQPATKSVNGQIDLRLGGTTVAFCHMLAWDTPLDVAPLPDDLLAQSPSPDMQLIGRFSGQKSVLWGMLTNGRIWRLISRQATSTSGVFYEVDLPDLIEVGAPDDRDLRWFAAFFSADWLHAPAGQPGLLDVVYQSGQLWAEKLGNDLKQAIFKDVFVDLANALAEGVRRTGSEPDLRTVYRATLVLLYRLLFMLYAESRHLLPLTTPSYYPNSLTYLLSTLALKQHSLVPKASVFSLQTDDPRLWLKLRALFQAIAAGNADWNVPHYNGGLFADDTSPAHELLASLDGVANDYLTKGLDRLARDQDARGATTENAVLRLIDYMDLDVRRLGSIYEGLLEFQLRRAKEHGEVIDGQLTPVSARKGRRNIGRLVQIGEVYLETTRQDRKASGSYYTPDYIVRYIIEQTVGPVLEQRAVRFGEAMSKLLEARTQLRRAEQKIDNPRYDLNDYRNKKTHVAALEEAAFEALLDLKVLDPAMGSGHFLVAAVNYLSDQIIAILQRHVDNPVLPRLAQVRAAIRKNLDEQGISGAVVPDQQISDRVLLRRMVMKRCIYGVDLNDMAVELAKLSLWLDSFAVGAPLSFLDHHLRWGNSLIGVWEVEKSILPGSGRWNEFMRALGYMVQVTRLTDSTNAEVAESKALYEQAQAALQPFREQFNVDLAVHFATLGDIGRARQIAYQSAADRAAWDAVTLTKFETAQQEAEHRRFFHNDHWLSEMFRPQLKAEYEQSLATLLPFKERLTRTDALIDQIVYQLYGLTLAEIAVVEGG
jgi:hypothetical protein